MRTTTILSALVTLTSLVLATATGSAADRRFYGDPPDDAHAWAVHDANRPLPPIITPGAKNCQPPSDAVVLFDGSSLDEWVTVPKGKGPKDPVPAQWKIVDGGAMEVVSKTGTLRSKKEFGDCQLHIEFATPKEVVGDSQGRGNSGVFLMGKYEIQVLDSYDNVTYADGQAASIYAQNPPLANACRAPGEWQAYDIVFHSTRFDESGNPVEPGTVTVFQNGVLVQDHWVFEGLAGHRKRPKLSPHGEKGPLELQDHGNPTRFRNIWFREIPPRCQPTPAAIKDQRAKTAAKLRQKSAAARADGNALQELKLLMESFIYEKNDATLQRLTELAGGYVAEVTKLDGGALKGREGEVKEMRSALKYLNDFQLVPAPLKAQKELETLMKSKGVKF